MSERIFVTYSLASGIPGQTIVPEMQMPVRNPATGVNLGEVSLPGLGMSRVDLGYHATLNYVDKNGRHFIAEAYPLVNFDTAWKKVKATFLEEVWLFGETNTDSNFGAIKVRVTQISPSSPDDQGYFGRPEETLATSEGSLGATWIKIVGAFREINDNYEYRPFSQNSNSSAAHAAAKAGLPEPTGETDDGRNLSLPGIDQELSNRISPLHEAAERLGIELGKTNDLRPLTDNPDDNPDTRISLSQIDNDTIVLGGLDETGKPFFTRAKELKPLVKEAAKFKITEDQLVRGQLDGGTDINGPEAVFNLFGDEFSLPVPPDHLKSVRESVDGGGLSLELAREDLAFSMPVLLDLSLPDTPPPGTPHPHLPRCRLFYKELAWARTLYGADIDSRKRLFMSYGYGSST